MLVYQDFSELKSITAPVHWALGMFDGLHMGHAEVIGSAVRGASKDGGLAAVLTFRRHPFSYVRPENVPAAIMAEQEEKFDLLAGMGVDIVLSLEFSGQLASLSPEEFIRTLCASCPVAEISVGEDWHFGRGRAGNVETLKTLSKPYGFLVSAVPPVSWGGKRVSSTRIREAVQQGDLKKAARMMGRPYVWKGEVIHGRELGRSLNYPTANMRPERELMPPRGVYAVRAQVNGQSYGGVANLGVRPTVEEKEEELLLETHLFGNPGDIYGAFLVVEPVRFLRPEIKFPSLAALKNQLAVDAKNAVDVLKQPE